MVKVLLYFSYFIIIELRGCLCQLKKLKFYKCSKDLEMGYNMEVEFDLFIL